MSCPGRGVNRGWRGATGAWGSAPASSGYENLVTVMETPTHEEYQSTLQWLGGRFDPEKFDPTQVRFDDPTRRYELAFEKPSRRSHRAGRTRPDNIRLQRSRAGRARR